MSEDSTSTYGGEKLERMVEPIGCGVVFKVLVIMVKKLWG